MATPKEQLVTPEKLAKWSASWKDAATQHVAQKAVTKNGIHASSENMDLVKNLMPANFAFSIDVDSEAVANQLQSGRCWMFACLNTLRWHIEKKLNLPHGTFELSQAFLTFYNKMERAAWFFEHIIETADRDLNDREVVWLLNAPMQDGGDWDMICGLIKKYGVVPHPAMGETYCTNDTSELNTVLSHLLREDALKLRQLVTENKDTDAAVQEMLSEVYTILATCVGEPPQTFDFQYVDKDNKYHADFGLTPKEFYDKYVPIDLDDYIGVINVPGANRPYYQMYAIADSNQIPNRENLYLNLPMDELKQLVIAQLKADEPVWFGSDVLQCSDLTRGALAMDLYDIEQMFGIKWDVDKEQRFDYRISLPTHAMVIAGVDMDGDKILKWKIENSWGTESKGVKIGHEGYFVSTDEWFDNYVYEVAIKKSLMNEKQQAALKTDPITWPFWDTFNPVSDRSEEQENL